MFSILFILCCAILNHSFAYFDPTKHNNWHLLQNAHCEGSTNSRIIGGTETAINEFPWIVWLISTSRMPGRQPSFQCGGSILNKKTVLTAAHCVTGIFERDSKEKLLVDEYGRPYKIDVIKVGLGDHNLFTNPDCAGCDTVQVRDVKEIIFHIGWDPLSLVNDIALIRLAQDIEFNSYIYPVCLPRGYLMEDRYTTFETIAAGWGMTLPHVKQISPTLQKVSLRVQDDSGCVSNWQLCAGGQGDGKGVCKGDSGGPLMIVDQQLTHGTPRFYAIGIVSHGNHDICAVVGHPQVFTRVASYMPWILDNLEQDTFDYERA